MRHRIPWLIAAALLAAALSVLLFVPSGRADQNCLGWDRAGAAPAGDTAPAADRPAIDRVDGDQPYGDALHDWLNDGCLRLNHLQVIGTHNSYHVEPQPTLLAAIAAEDPLVAASFEYTHRPLAEQLGALGVRQVELDVFADPDGGLYAVPLGPLLLGELPTIHPELFAPGLKVLHVQDLDFETRCLTFVICLSQLKAWSDANPAHLPVMVLVEAKDDSIGPPFVTPVPFDAAQLDGIDAEIRSMFSADRLITPDDVRGDRTTLESAVLSDGWPTLQESRGRFLFALDNTDAKRDQYIAGHPSLQGRVMFTSSTPGDPEAAFVKVNDPVGGHDLIQQLVAAGYLVRTRADADTVEARFNLTARRDAALESGAHFVSTDYPEPDTSFSPYMVDIPGVARCNPVLAPPDCDSSTLEP